MCFGRTLKVLSLTKVVKKLARSIQSGWDMAELQGLDSLASWHWYMMYFPDVCHDGRFVSLSDLLGAGTGERRLLAG